MSTFVCKRTLTVEHPSGILNESEGSQPKKMRVSLKTTKQQQSSLLNFFTSRTTNNVRESVSSNIHFDTKKLVGNDINNLF